MALGGSKGEFVAGVHVECIECVVSPDAGEENEHRASWIPAV